MATQVAVLSSQSHIRRQEVPYLSPSTANSREVFRPNRHSINLPGAGGGQSKPTTDLQGDVTLFLDFPPDVLIVKRPKRRQAVQIIKSILLISVICAVQPAWAQGRAAAVGVQSVDTQVFSETAPVFAQVITARDGAVAGRISGNVDMITVLAGDTVEPGDVLIELNAELLSIRLTQSEAQIAEAQAGTRTASARLARAQVAFDRVNALREAASFSQGRFEDLEAELLEAKSQLAEADAREKTAEARLAEAAYQLDRSLIKAPFSGVILEVLTIPGAFIQAGTPVVRLVDTSAFEVRANVPARYAGSLEAGTIVRGQTEDGTVVDLILRAILPVEDPSTRTRAVLFTTTETSANALVAVGQSLTVDIPIGAPREMVSAPKDALVQGQGGPVTV